MERAKRRFETGWRPLHADWLGLAGHGACPSLALVGDFPAVDFPITSMGITFPTPSVNIVPVNPDTMAQ